MFLALSIVPSTERNCLIFFGLSKSSVAFTRPSLVRPSADEARLKTSFGPNRTFDGLKARLDSFSRVG